jgi:hypothetical protein
MSTWLRTTGYFVFMLSMLLIAGLLSVSYSATLYLVIGVLAAWLITFIVSRILKSRGEWLGASVAVIGVVLCIIVGGLFLVLISFRERRMMVLCTPGETMQTRLTEYHIIIEPIDFSQRSFRVLEGATYDVERHVCNPDRTTSVSVVEKDTVLSLPERQIHSSNRGLFIQEVHVTPLDGSPLSGYTCCPETKTVELRDFPRNSFYEARDVQKVEPSRYLDTEIVRWDTRRLGQDIVFAYVAPPFHLLRNFFTPLIGISYQSQWMVTFVGLIAGAVIKQIVKPALFDFGKSRFKSLLERKPPKPD